ncbi:MAG TPA: hypothetical protein VMT52_07995 [Planctomycetota bacterium]|nr:hypothetical protein [Planctomycetota bacterium]
MLEFVDKLARSPASITAEDREALRDAGVGSLETLQVVLGAAHFNYLNRVADGLGIRLEYASSLPDFAIEPRSAAPHPPSEARVHAGSAPAPARSARDLSARASGEPSNLLDALRENPEARDIVREWRAHHFRGTPALGARDRARIALHVAALEGCGHSVLLHRTALEGMGDDPELLTALSAREAPPGLPRRDALLLGHARRLALEPWTAREEHVDELRREGLGDAGVLQLTLLVAYQTFEDRVVLGLGIR